MSGSLYWNLPAEKHAIKGNDLRLRSALIAEHGLDNGIVCLTYQDTPFLRGLAVGGIEGAQELVDVITEHGQIEISIEY